MNLTLQALESLLKSDQRHDEYDLFLIDNGSSPDNSNQLKDYIRSSFLPVKNAIFTPEASVSQAWNLFMALARNYDYRTKFDNDMVLNGTVKISTPKPMVTRNPGDHDPKSGAPQSGPPILGLGHVHAARKRREQVIKERKSRNTEFLNHLENFSTEHAVDLISLVPVSPNQTFVSMWTELVQKLWKGLPYLFGACMMISKQCFDTIGYFDERLPRRIDIDYSQRALRSKMNIGYHDWYYAIHIGAKETTEPNRGIVDQKYEYAMRVERELGPVEGFAPSQWQNAIEKIENLAIQNKIINML